MPKVSILLPVHNSVGDTNFLQQMLDSIVHQTYKNFELLILDNQSTDSTVKICKNMANQDSRIRVYMGTKQRSTEGAINKLISMARGEFVTTMCAYDLLNHHYIKALVDELKANENIDMVYTNGRYINIDNRVGKGLITSKEGGYTSIHYYENFFKAVHSRKVLPFIFGLFRKEIYKTLWPYESPQTDVDSLWAAKFFLNKYRASFVDYEAFYYRYYDRPFELGKTEDLPPNPVLIWIYYVYNQLDFYNTICSFIDETNHSEHTIPLKMTTLDSCLNICGTFLNWVGRRLIKDAFEHTIIKNIYKQYEPINKLKLPAIYPQDNIQEHQNTMRLRCKILEERVMEYIIPIVQDITSVLETQNVIAEIKKDIITQLNSKNYTAP